MEATQVSILAYKASMNNRLLVPELEWSAGANILVSLPMLMMTLHIFYHIPSDPSDRAIGVLPY